MDGVKALVVLASIYYPGDGIVAKNNYQTSSGQRYDQSAPKCLRADLGVQAQPAQSAQMCVKIAADSFSDVAIPHSAANPKSFT
jgi:hypothetical protein